MADSVLGRGAYPGKATEKPSHSFTPEGMADFHHGMKSGMTNHGGHLEIPRPACCMPGQGGTAGGVEKSGSVQGHASQSEMMDMGTRFRDSAHKRKLSGGSFGRGAYHDVTEEC